MSELLNDVEIKSAAWMKIEQHLESRLSSLREKNDGDLCIEDTAKNRGRIAEIKELLKSVHPVRMKTRSDRPSNTVDDRLESMRKS